MATAHGRPAAALKNTLLDQPDRFSLTQALRLLALDLRAQGLSQEDALRHVGIVPWLSLAWPPAEVTGLRVEWESGEDAPGAEAPSYTLETPLFGLYSTQGPLPTLYTEELLDNARVELFAVKDFLDLINNRLAHAWCRADLHYNHPRRLIEQGDPTVERVLNGLMGRAYPELRPDDLPRPQAAELLLAPRTATGLAAYIAFELDWPHVEVEECVPRHAPIPEDQRCALGRANCSLGKDSFVGSEIPDVSGKIRIHLRELPEAELQNQLSGMPGHAALTTCVRHYMDAALDFDIVLHPAVEIPENHVLGSTLRVGCHLPPRCAAPRQPVTVYRRPPS